MTADEKREQLRRWLDRKSERAAHWRDWFDADGEYLGEVSARTGPDVVTVDEAVRRAK